MKVEILSDGDTCWVNEWGGGCIGRFRHSSRKIYMDVLSDARGPEANDNSFIESVQGGTWAAFQASMLKHHGVAVPDAHKPVLA